MDEAGRTKGVMACENTADVVNCDGNYPQLSSGGQSFPFASQCLWDDDPTSHSLGLSSIDLCFPPSVNPVLPSAFPEQTWSGPDLTELEGILEPNTSTSGAAASLTSSTDRLPSCSPATSDELPSQAFIPAAPPLKVLTSAVGLTSADWEEAAQQGVPVRQMSFYPNKDRKKRNKKSLAFHERQSRALGIVGWAALDRFKQVKASPLQLWIRSDRYPAVLDSAPSSPFVRAVPKTKALLPHKLPASLPHALSYIECGFRDPNLPVERCRVLCPTMSSWEAHQFQVKNVKMKIHDTVLFSIRVTPWASSAPTVRIGCRLNKL